MKIATKQSEEKTHDNENDVGHDADINSGHNC